MAGDGPSPSSATRRGTALRAGMITARYRSAMTGWPRSLPRATGLLALASVPVIAVISVSGAGHGAAATLASPPSDASSWTVYHHDVAGTGVTGRRCQG